MKLRDGFKKGARCDGVERPSSGAHAPANSNPQPLGSRPCGFNAAQQL
jgi:hypothetical protein